MRGICAILKEKLVGGEKNESTCQMEYERADMRGL